MANQTHKTGTSVYRNRSRTKDIHLPEIHNPRWATLAEGAACSRTLDKLQRLAQSHVERALAKMTAKPQDRDFATEMGLKSKAQNFGTMLSASRAAAAEARELASDMRDARIALYPFPDADKDNPTAATTRASIRAAICAMPEKVRGEFVRDAKSPIERRAIFELRKPQYVGLPANSGAFKLAFDKAMDIQNHERLEQIEALEALARQTTRMASGVEEQARAEAADENIFSNEDLERAVSTAKSARAYSNP